MRILTPAEQIMFSTVRVETTLANGQGSGTAFGYHYLVENGYYNFLVTNKHVVEGAHEGELIFTRSNGDTDDEQPMIGQQVTIHMTNFEVPWFPHPDPNVDIAVLSLAHALADLQNQGNRVYLKAIPSDLSMIGTELERLDALEPVVFVGYPNGMYDTVNLTPIFRSGVTATHPALDYCGEKTFLIDASVFPGSSGSPVFLFNSGSYAEKQDSGPIVAIGNRVRLLGVLSSVFTRADRGRIEIDDIPVTRGPVAVTNQMIDLGLVVKAETINETIRGFLDTPQQREFEASHA